MKHARITTIGILWLGFLWVFGVPAAGAPTGVGDPPAGAIAGKVVSNKGQPADHTEVTILELRRQTTTNAEGAFVFDDVPFGMWTLQAVSSRFGSGLQQVVLERGQREEVTISLDLAVHQEQVSVTADLEARGLADVAQPVNVLSGTELQQASQPTLGETLAQTPGVNSTYFGPGASRPVIRGLGGDRIRILENGIGVGDASNVSPDHAVSTDPLTAERIEIVRGPATLLYGSNAMGGVVNILDNRIPDHLQERAIGGTVDLAAGTVADERQGSLALDGDLGQFAWRVSALAREADDYETPEGTLDNTAIESDEESVGLSWIAKKAFVGVSVNAFDTLYGVPGDEPIQIDMEQRRADLRGQVDTPDGKFRGLRFRVGVTDYEHVELEPGGKQGTQFTNDSWEGRLEAPHRKLGPLAGGVLGLQLSSRDFEAVGKEAIVPPTTTDNRAAFFYEEVGPDTLRFSFGGRYENQDVGVDDPILPDRSFDAFSASTGVVWKAGEAYTLAFSLARSVRPPVAEELYINGAHPATAQFEIGDPDLDKESSLGLDVSLRKVKGRLSGELTIFANRFKDFVFLRPTGDVDPESGFDVFQFVQEDADYHGGELHADVELLHRDPHHLAFEVLADAVRAEVRETSEPLPFIPPLRAGVGLHYQGAALWARIGVRRTFEQDRVAQFETTTDAFTTYNASAGYRFFQGRLVHDVILVATNLSDELARNHVSPLKEVAPLPSRDVRLSYRLVF